MDPRVRREAEALAENGLEVHVISLSEMLQAGSEPASAFVNGVSIHRLPIKRRRGSLLRYFYEYSMTIIRGGVKLALLHFGKRIAVVDIHNMPDLLVLAALVPRIGGCKLVLDVHDPMPELYMSWNHGPHSLVVRCLRFQQKFSCWLADLVLSVSETMRENLRARGVEANKLTIIHNYPDQRQFPLCNLPQSWPRRANSLVVLYCGTVTAHYDLALAVRAIAALAGEVPVRLRIMGSGNDLHEVVRLASSLGLDDSLQLIGNVPIEKVAEEMRRADIGLSCHRAGIFGDLYFSTKIIEYLTQGLCVVTARTYTISKYFSEDSVFFFEPGNAAALADVIRYVWNHPADVVARLGRGRRLLPQLSWEAEKQQLWAVYLSLLVAPTRRNRLPWRPPEM